MDNDTQLPSEYDDLPQLASAEEETQLAVIPTNAGVETAGDLFGSLQSIRPICTKCQIEVDPFKAQIKSKGGQRYTCNICNAKCTAISRMFGRWPAEEFGELSRDELTEFWRKARESNSGHGLKMLFLDNGTTPYQHS